MKKLFVVLLSVEAFSNGRKIAENIENQTFKNPAELEKTIAKAEDLRPEDITFQYLPISDFMDGCNNQEIELEGVWVSYVYLKKSTL